MAKISNVIGKDALLNFCKRKCEPRYIEALDAEVNIRLLSVRETMEFSEKEDELESVDVAVLYTSYLLGDENGDRMFTDMDDVRELPTAALMQISNAGSALNNVGKDEVEATAKK